MARNSKLGIFGITTGDVESALPSSNVIVNVPTFAFTLAFGAIVVAKDHIIILPAAKEFTLNLSTGVQVFASTLVDVPTKALTLTFQPITVFYDTYSEFMVMESSPFNYEILGVNVGTFTGSGTMTLFVDGVVAGTSVPFNSTSTNLSLSGIIDRGQRLTIGLLIYDEEPLTSFSANFAFKRTA
jgi:hypothetical protein